MKLHVRCIGTLHLLPHPYYQRSFELIKLGACCKGNEGHAILPLTALPPKKSRAAPFKSACLDSTLDRQWQGTANSRSPEVWLKLTVADEALVKDMNTRSLPKSLELHWNLHTWT